MKLTYNWLCDHINTTLTPQQVGERLTMIGLELESKAHLGAGLERVRTGRLLSVERHPNADRLTRCSVRVGKETLAIVCGASNHKVGDIVAVALEGAELPNGLTIKKGVIRGETSEGMLCSVVELGLAESADGVLILPAGTPDGVAVAEVLGRNDTLFEVNVTPNRGDCLGVRGIARDLGAAIGETLLPLPKPMHEDHAVAKRHPVAVIIEDAAGCPRYAGRVISGVRIGPSPAWLRNRLEAVGVRSINNVVDVTNFILMDLGHPLHAFDLAKLEHPIVVRNAFEGERLTTLDGVERTLSAEMTLIADQRRPLALAGIMGGEESGVTDLTSDIFLEAAYFEPVRIARTGRRLGIISESRYRFERGVDPMGIQGAIERATRLIVDLAGGSAGPVILADAGSWTHTPPIAFRAERASRLGGIDLSAATCDTYLQRLGFVNVTALRKEETGPGVAWYQPPSHRHDVRREEDLQEEVVRLYGYDQVPSRMPAGPILAQQPDPMNRDRIHAILCGLGYLEAINFAFVSHEAHARFDRKQAPIALINPISEEQAVMRTTLIAGLLEAARRNLSHGNNELRLYELGRIFLTESSGKSVEQDRVALLLAGAAQERSWHQPIRLVDLFDLKGDLESLLAGVSGVRMIAGGPDFLHPGRKGVIVREDGMEIGWFGELHPNEREALQITQPLLIAECDLVSLLERTSHGTEEKLSRFPAVERDFAFLLPAATPAGAVVEMLEQVDTTLVRGVGIVDVYTGQGVPCGQKSVALGVTVQASDHTLTEAELQTLTEKIIASMEKRFSATLRSS